MRAAADAVVSGVMAAIPVGNCRREDTKYRVVRKDNHEEQKRARGVTRERHHPRRFGRMSNCRKQ